MFRKKKSSLRDNDSPVPRGRTPQGTGTGAERGAPNNPLARRFQVDNEPPTIDLSAPPGFRPTQCAADDPKTEPLRTATGPLSRFISYESDTGKFYIHPGSENLPVTLQGEPVAAPTELRRGDVIRIGNAEFHFHSSS